MKKDPIQYLCQEAAIAAIYTALSLIFAPISFGPIQCRISEMLTVLPAFTAAAVPGLAIGCVLANTLGGAIVPDIIFGSLATLIGAVCTRMLCREIIGQALALGKPDANLRLRAILPPIISNTVIVPLVLKYAYHFEDGLFFMIITVCVGEIISCGIFGSILMAALCRTRFSNLFR